MLRFLVFAFFASASAEVYGEGHCPEVKPVENFNFSAYAGKWYEIARFPNAGQAGDKGKCTTAEYTVDGDKGTVKNTHVIEGVAYVINGVINLEATSEVRLTYTFNGKSKNSWLTVLFTDYNNYSVGYSCKYFEEHNKHQVFSWIKSRSKTLEGDAKKAVDEYLKNSKVIDTSKYVKNDQSDETCKVTSTQEIKDFL